MKYYLMFALLLVSFNAQAGLHKWVDSEGRVHYSDEPPPSGAKTQETLSVQSYNPISSPASATSSSMTIFEREAAMEKERKEKEKAAQKAAKEQQQAAAKQQNCEQARSQLLTLQNTARISTYDENGQRTIMDDDARQKAMEQTQADINKFCN